MRNLYIHYDETEDFLKTLYGVPQEKMPRREKYFEMEKKYPFFKATFVIEV